MTKIKQIKNTKRKKMYKKRGGGGVRLACTEFAIYRQFGALVAN
jgi:hypothetical protein